MSESEKSMLMWLGGGIAALLAVVFLVVSVHWYFRGPRASKVLASKVVGIQEWFDWSPLTGSDARHVLWMRMAFEFEGYEDTDAGVRIQLQIDDGPLERYIWQCDPEPGDYGTRGSWLTHLRTDGAGGASLTATIWVCGFRPRSAGVPVRLRGRVLGAANMKSGTFELKFARR